MLGSYGDHPNALLNKCPLSRRLNCWSDAAALTVVGRLFHIFWAAASIQSGYWILSLNISKCKVLSYGRTLSFKGQYYIDDERLEKVDTIKDLRLTFRTNLKFRQHIIDKVNRAYFVIGIIQRNFMYLSEKSFCTIYKAIVRSQLEYAVSVWKRKEDILRIEKVQMRATKIVSSVKQ